MYYPAAKGVFYMAHKEHGKVTASSVKMLAEITKHEDGSIYGKLDCMYFEEPFRFIGLMRMIEMMEDAFDIKGFPEKELLPRAFGKEKQRLRKNELDLSALAKARTLKKGSAGSIGNTKIKTQHPDGKTCKFEISVRTRHNAEWQGSVHWIEGDEKKKFSSTVELLRLIDTALSS